MAVPAPTANMITSTVTVRESAWAPSPPPRGGIPKSSDVVGIGRIDVSVDIDIAGVDSGWW
jgi:hypothetical protein